MPQSMIATWDLSPLPRWRIQRSRIFHYGSDILTSMCTRWLKNSNIHFHLIFIYCDLFVNFVFQGNHEHLFSFVDVRLLSADDNQRPSRYPFIRAVGMRHSKYCMVCDANIAKWVTTNNTRVRFTTYPWIAHEVGEYRNPFMPLGSRRPIPLLH